MHPLVKASSAAYTPFSASGSKGGRVQVNESARELYLRPERAFAVFHTAPKLVVVRALRGLCRRREGGEGGCASAKPHSGASLPRASWAGALAVAEHALVRVPRVGGKGGERDGGESEESKRRRLTSPQVEGPPPDRGHVPILRGAAGP